MACWGLDDMTRISDDWDPRKNPTSYYVKRTAAMSGIHQGEFVGPTFKVLKKVLKTWRRGTSSSSLNADVGDGIWVGTGRSAGDDLVTTCQLKNAALL